MNCECFYLIKENTMDAARDLAKRIGKTANDRMMELFPVCISQAKRDFLATGDYDNCGREFLVKEGDASFDAPGRKALVCPQAIIEMKLGQFADGFLVESTCVRRLMEVQVAAEDFIGPFS